MDTYVSFNRKFYSLLRKPTTDSYKVCDPWNWSLVSQRAHKNEMTKGHKNLQTSENQKKKAILPLILLTWHKLSPLHFFTYVKYYVNVS